jgi:hypothetical protein
MQDETFNASLFKKGLSKKNGRMQDETFNVSLFKKGLIEKEWKDAR